MRRKLELEHGGLAVGVDIGASKVLGILVGRDGVPIATCRVPTPQLHARDVVAAIEHVVSVVDPDRARCCVGVATVGTIDPQSRRISRSFGFVPGWEGLDLAAIVEERTATETHVLNDCHAHGLAEARFGMAVARASALVVAVGSGIGSAVLRDSAPVEGARGLAGAVGHMTSPFALGRRCRCGADGHLESVASGFGMVNEFRRAGGRNVDALQAVVSFAEEGGTTALEVFRVGGEALGVALVQAIAVLDPEVVVLAGGAVAPHPTYRHAIQTVLERHRSITEGVRVVASELGPHGAAVGAGLYALQAHRELPSAKDGEAR